MDLDLMVELCFDLLPVDEVLSIFIAPFNQVFNYLITLRNLSLGSGLFLAEVILQVFNCSFHCSNLLLKCKPIFKKKVTCIMDHHQLRLQSIDLPFKSAHLVLG
uniref:Uncharacterized protein n=1 Tax=Strombidium inclinatum TaxID=197538 RepID=A0A7S3N123_9SPIT|mmetsp:Transcript_37361/g.57258  ORF Transcript_37361/g.57258 Transcript_37361/m.57258 type:complete len:104 (+) Transcript_37361:164-475(+)